ncbi:MAG TPA: hypothetical protein VMA95_08640 [Streptosporangiaceae bacterium]|nr:hypothetical protein [Streptosporangiaceae bacterium]
MHEAPRVLVISLQKAGTHLMQGLMLQLGYKMAGVPRPSPDNQPVFGDEQLLQLASVTRSRDDYARLAHLRGPELARRTLDDWPALGWAWQRRLGQRVVNRYGQSRFDFADSVITNPYISYTKFADTPPGLCWIYHELDIDKVDGNFLQEWTSTGQPPIVFNYRDPRDTVVSMINFLEGRTAAGYGNFHEFDVFHQILGSMSSWEEKIDYALRDRSFLGWDQFEKAVWLLHHPGVCKVSFEELVGPRGGGSRELQVAALQRVFDHVGSAENPEKIADAVYDPGSWSFYQGKVSSWRDYFTGGNLACFDEQHPWLLRQYGYR